jgi:glutamyl-tRNA reductase
MDGQTPGTLSWRTCLRDVTFVNDGHRLLTSCPGVIADADAYALLLEILCGLRSPMLGETQVMGQFKDFLASVAEEHGWLRRVGQQLLTDARAVRERYLQRLGTRSYGSAVRQRVAGCEHIAVVGTGKLAAEVLCFVAGQDRAVDVWGRRPASPFDPMERVTYCPLADLERVAVHDVPTAIVVAAPAPASTISAVAAKYPNVRLVVDLRGEPRDGAIDVHAPLVSLADIFSEMQAARRHAEAQCNEAKREIQRRSRRFVLRDDRRPFGWDDLCA